MTGIRRLDCTTVLPRGQATSVAATRDESEFPTGAPVSDYPITNTEELQARTVPAAFGMAAHSVPAFSTGGEVATLDNWFQQDAEGVYDASSGGPSVFRNLRRVVGELVGLSLATLVAFSMMLWRIAQGDSGGALIMLGIVLAALLGIGAVSLASKS